MNERDSVFLGLKTCLAIMSPLGKEIMVDQLSLLIKPTQGTVELFGNHFHVLSLLPNNFRPKSHKIIIDRTRPDHVTFASRASKTSNFANLADNKGT